MTDRLSAGQLRDIADAAERGFNAHGSSQLAVLADELRKEAADREREEKPAPSPCKCGHAASAHIYDTGKCRPGFLCPDDCAEYTPKLTAPPSPGPTREDWRELAKRLRNTDPISGVALAQACDRIASGEDVIARPGQTIDYDSWFSGHMRTKELMRRAERAESKLAEVERELVRCRRHVTETRDKLARRIESADAFLARTAPGSAS